MQNRVLACCSIDFTALSLPFVLYSSPCQTKRFCPPLCFLPVGSEVKGRPHEFIHKSHQHEGNSKLFAALFLSSLSLLIVAAICVTLFTQSKVTKLRILITAVFVLNSRKDVLNERLKIRNQFGNSNNSVLSLPCKKKTIL